MKTRDLFLIMSVLFSSLNTANADNLISPDVAAKKVEIRNVEVKGNAISGEVINRSSHTLRAVELLIQYHWLWSNEFKPGEASHGKAVFVAVDKELRPGESATFTVPVDPPAASGADGYYMTEVTLAGFTEIIPATVG
jgi:hypothetical protein